ncbi:hypothetical protein NNJEOMEG_02875 [Fundidesulfovibrio magnetotacticus]|uniref:Ribosomal methyltransferase Rsm22 n=1 Tax=Fundidesulfovibrio magnetotacticus TaxID=2730080 RepID=A0A6V8LZF5_9BACT|nr:small ribosomal subunit Rsm22 family protein [Fundidesulfovibrio magnetotacticus]GFK95027.1 hypothetical protein NNJEOMEG_02875 [Fundidesulfovibrio magnetotacticus]
MPDERGVRPGRCVPLFPRPGAKAMQALEGYRQVLAQAHPLRPRHQAELPGEIKRLSLALTAERGPGPQANYLAAPGALAAYLHYFLPWNLYRLSRLFAGLAPDLPEGSSVLDLGCGPLTMVQALWIARPELRGRKLRFVCVDQTGQALRAGRALFEALSGEAGRAWSVETVQAPAHKAPQEPFRAVWSANAAGEMVRGRGEEGHESLERSAGLFLSRLAHDGHVLLVEPGTRHGGRLLSRLREVFLEEGLAPQAPCTHHDACPMLAPRWRSWCHFVFPADDVPRWLASLTRASGLEKDRASLSFLLAGAEVPEPAVDRWRVVSHRFPLAGGQGAYLCGGEGLRLLGFSTPPPGLVSGALLEARLPEPRERDPKSGAWLAALDTEPERERTAEAPEAHGAGPREERGVSTKPGVQADPKPGGAPGSSAGRGGGPSRPSGAPRPKGGRATGPAGGATGTGREERSRAPARTSGDAPPPARPHGRGPAPGKTPGGKPGGKPGARRPSAPARGRGGRGGGGRP